MSSFSPQGGRGNSRDGAGKLAGAWGCILQADTPKEAPEGCGLVIFSASDWISILFATHIFHPSEFSALEPQFLGFFKGGCEVDRA